MPKIKLARGLNRLRPDTIAQRYIGDEPTWNDIDRLSQDQIEDRFNKALNWYNYVMVDDDYLAVVQEFLHAMDYPAETVKAIRSLSWWELAPAMCKMARMMLRGYTPSEKRFAWFSDKLDEAIAVAVKRAHEESLVEAKKAAKATVSIQERVNEATGNLLAEVEEQVDHFFDTYDETWRAYDWLVKRQVKPMHAGRIADYYRKLHAELSAAREKNADPDLKAAWSHLSSKRLLAAVNFVDAIVRDCDLWSKNTKASRKPRKRKVKTAEKQVARVKYQKEDTSLQVVSLDPTRVVGATEAWLYNTKYKVLYHYVAQDAGGFTVKGTSLKNVDLKASQGRALRKPKDVLASITSGGAKAAVKMFNALKTKPRKATGRINGQTMILRVVK
jgi:hypothetical protein